MAARLAPFALSLPWFPLLALPSSAQLPQVPEAWSPPDDPCRLYEPANVIDWPGGEFGDPAGFKRMLFAELDNDLSRDGVVLCSGVLSVLWNVATFDLPQHVVVGAPGNTIADVAVLPGANPAGGDLVILSDDVGLRSVAVNSGLTVVNTIAPGGAWLDASPIHVDRLDQAHGLDIVGVATDHRTIVTLLSDGAGGFTQGPTFSAPSNVRDVVAVDWDADGVRELAALTLRGVVVFRMQAGPPITPIMHLDATGCIVRVLTPGAPGGELLAWTRGITGGSELKILGSIGPSLPATTLPEYTNCGGAGPLVPVALLAGDYDDEPGEELLIAHEAHQSVVMLANLNTSPWFAPGNTARFDIIPIGDPIGQTCNVGIPAFDQLDGQTSDDIAIPVDSRIVVSTVASDYRAYNAQTTQFIRSSDVVLDICEYRPGTSPAAGAFRFAYDVPNLTAYDGYTHLKMIVWHQDSNSPTADREAVYVGYHALAATLPEDRRQWVQLDCAFPSGACWDAPQHYFYTQFKFVTWDGNLAHQPTAGSPNFTGGFTLRLDCQSTDLNFYVYLQEQGNNQGFLLREYNNLDGDPNQYGSTFVGAYVPMSSQPPFQPNAVLVFPSFTDGGGAALIGQPPPAH